jgi:hypothetical protein
MKEQVMRKFIVILLLIIGSLSIGVAQSLHQTLRSVEWKVDNISRDYYIFVSREDLIDRERRDLVLKCDEINASGIIIGKTTYPGVLSFNFYYHIDGKKLAILYHDLGGHYAPEWGYFRLTSSKKGILSFEPEKGERLRPPFTLTPVPAKKKNK